MNKETQLKEEIERYRNRRKEVKTNYAQELLKKAIRNLEIELKGFQEGKQSAEKDEIEFIKKIMLKFPKILLSPYVFIYEDLEERLKQAEKKDD